MDISEMLYKHQREEGFTGHSFNKDQIIHCEGDICQTIDFILAGKVCVRRLDERGNSLMVAEQVPGEFIGGNLVFASAPLYPLTVIARTEARLLCIEKKAFFGLLRQSPELLTYYLNTVSDQSLQLAAKIKVLFRQSIRETLLEYLARECQKQHCTTIQMKISKKDLAEHLGIQRTSLSRELTRMRDDGLIEYDARSITFLRTK